MTTDLGYFSGEEIIADVLLDFPEAQEILTTHGIACASCHINQYETLRQGIVAHYGEDMYWTIIQDLNEAAEESGLLKGEKSTRPEVVLTEIAKDKIIEFQEDAAQSGFGLKVEVLDNGGDLSYFLDFQDRPDKGDKIIESQGIKIFLNTESDRLLRGKQINYAVTEDDEGFKFEKVN